MLRKHILHLDKDEFVKNPTFFGWNCITLQIKKKWDVNLIFESDRALNYFIKLLIYHMDTIDGVQGTSLNLKNHLI